jgi:nucleoid-associated protein YgaU
MGIIAFIKEAGEKLFGKPEVQAAQAAVNQNTNPVTVAALNSAAGDAIKAYIDALGLKATALTVTFGEEHHATVYGVAPDQETKEKIILAAGNVEGVAGVVDRMTVDQSAPEAQYYTVVKGDTLSKIAKQHYGDPNKYAAIFEANEPMLKHPDKIYPGQVLRIPPL